MPFIDLVGAGQIGAAISAVFNLVPCLLFAWGVSSFVSGLRWVLDALTTASIRVPVPLAAIDVPVNYIDLFRLRSFYNSMIYWDDRLWIVFLLVFLLPWIFSIVGGALYGTTLAAIYNMVGKTSGGMRVRLVAPQSFPSGQAGPPAAWSGGQMPGPPRGQSPGSAPARVALRAPTVSDDRSYVQQLGEVLRQRDVAALRVFLEGQAGRYGDQSQVDAIRAQSDAEIEALLHRMIVSRPDLSALHAESRRWLARHAS